MSSIENIFSRINHHYYTGDQTLLFDLFQENIDTAAVESFSNDYLQHDLFFNQFTPIWINLIQTNRFKEAENIWHYAISIALRWEKHNPQIHKGTPYYFLGVTQILATNLEDGFLSMHRALEEDIRTHSSNDPSTPAYFFTTLDYTKVTQFFRTKVLDITRFLDIKIEDYNKTRGGNLELIQVKSRFLENHSYREEVFIFVYFIFRLKKILIEISEEMRKNEFSSLMLSKMLFDLCLIIEKVIEYKHPEKGNRPLYFSDEITFLRDNGIITITQNQVQNINRDFKNNFEQTLQRIINNTYGRRIQKIEEDIMIAYRIRNFAAHNMEKFPIFYESISEISQRLLNALFFVIEHLLQSTSTSLNTTSTITETIRPSNGTFITNRPPDRQMNNSEVGRARK